jgi:hypothetical protein
MTLQFIDTSIVAQRFQAIPEVKSIFEGLVNGAKTFWIITSNETYDDMLMDRLLSLEEQTLDSYPGAKLSFEYIPAILIGSPEEKVSASATSIFER